MKIKNSVNFAKPAVFLTVFAAALAVCIPLRFYQILNLIDTSTGFFNSESPVTVIFYAVLIAASAFLIIASFISKDVPTLERSNLDKNPAAGISCIVLAFGLFTDWTYNMYLVLSAENHENGLITHQASSFSSSMKSGVLPAKITSVFAILSAVYFICLAIGCFKKKNRTSSVKLSAIIPMFWGITKMVTFFVKQISFVRVSDLILEISALAFLSIFLLSFAQRVSGIYDKEASWRIIGVGLTAALFCFVLNIPKLYFTIADPEHILNDYPVNYAELAFGIFITVIVLTSIKCSKKAIPVQEAVSDVNESGEAQPETETSEE